MKKNINIKIMGASIVLAFFMFAASCGSSSGVDNSTNTVKSGATTYQELAGYWFMSNLKNAGFSHGGGGYYVYHLFEDGTFERKTCMATGYDNQVINGVSTISENHIIIEFGSYVINSNDRMTGRDTLERVSGNNWPSCP